MHDGQALDPISSSVLRFDSPPHLYFLVVFWVSVDKFIQCLLRPMSAALDHDRPLCAALVHNLFHQLISFQYLLCLKLSQMDESNTLLVPFAQYSRELHLHNLNDGTCARTVKIDGSVITGAGHGKSIVLLVYKEIEGKKGSYFIDIYDPQMTKRQQRIDSRFFGENKPFAVDISPDATRLAVLTSAGQRNASSICLAQTTQGIFSSTEWCQAPRAGQCIFRTSRTKGSLLTVVR
jgi:hypothetical protein